MRARCCVRRVGTKWAALLVGHTVLLSDLGTVTGLTFFGATPEDAEREAKAYLGMAESVN